MAEFDYVIFDFDGTVVDTGEGIIKSLQYSFSEMGREVPDMRDLKKFIGPPIYYSYTTYYGVSEEEVGEYIKKYRERYKVKGIYECHLYEGLSELLDSLREKGIRTGIASSKPEHLIYSVADYLGVTEKFDAIVGVKIDDSNHSSKTGLVLEGGGVRGIYTAGVLDVFMEKGIGFDGVIGVSAGAIHACSYISGQKGRSIRYYKKYSTDPRFMGLECWLKTGDVVGADFCYRELPDELDIFDHEAFYANPTPYYVVCADVETGKPVYKQQDLMQKVIQQQL